MIMLSNNSLSSKNIVSVKHQSYYSHLPFSRRTCRLKIQKLPSSFSCVSLTWTRAHSKKEQIEKVGKTGFTEYACSSLSHAKGRDLVASYLKLLGLKTVSFLFTACWVKGLSHGILSYFEHRQNLLLNNTLQR